MRNPSLVLLAVTYWAVVLCQAGPPLSTEQRRLNLDSFDYVWKTVRDKHWDPKLGGVDWQAVREQLRPRAEAAASTEEVRQVMTEMLERLHQTHFGIIPADAYETLGDTGSTSEKEEGQTGIELRILENRAIVSSVVLDSPAKDAGVRTGWEVVRIGRTDAASVIAKLGEPATHSRFAELMTVRALASRLDGPVDSEVAVMFADMDGREFTKHLARRVPAGELARFGFLPPRMVNFDARKLPGNIEYIRFNIFLKPDIVVTRFGEAVRECGSCPGVIIDLRGNPGGLGAMATGIAGFLISRPDQKLGTMQMRSLPLRFVIFPRAQAYEGRVAVLVDGFSASTTEIFAGGLQDLKRARIFGERTAGAALPSQIERLPNGDGFQFAVANYISESGRQLEGNGVMPDEVVPLSRKALAEGHDSALEAALRWLSPR